MSASNTESRGDAARLQFRLRSLFVLTTIVAYVSGFAHYVGGLTLLRHFLSAMFPFFAFLFFLLAPLLLVEFLIVVFDFLFGLSIRSPLPGRRRFE